MLSNKSLIGKTNGKILNERVKRSIQHNDQPCRRKLLKSGLKSGDITNGDLCKHFDKPIEEVARNFGICTSVLKKICRKHGIYRWPFRQIRSLDRSIECLKLAQINSNEDSKIVSINLQMKALKKRRQQLMLNELECDDNYSRQQKIENNVKCGNTFKDDEENKNNDINLQNQRKEEKDIPNLSMLKEKETLEKIPQNFSYQTTQLQQTTPNVQEIPSCLVHQTPLPNRLYFIPQQSLSQSPHSFIHSQYHKNNQGSDHFISHLNMLPYSSYINFPFDSNSNNYNLISNNPISSRLSYHPIPQSYRYSDSISILPSTQKQEFYQMSLPSSNVILQQSAHSIPSFTFPHSSDHKLNNFETLNKYPVQDSICLINTRDYSSSYPHSTSEREHFPNLHHSTPKIYQNLDDYSPNVFSQSNSRTFSYQLPSIPLSPILHLQPDNNYSQDDLQCDKTQIQFQPQQQSFQLSSGSVLPQQQPCFQF